MCTEGSIGAWLQDLDKETLEHIDAENRRQTLEEQIEFLKSIHDQVRFYVLSVECRRDILLRENYGNGATWTHWEPEIVG